MTDIAIPAPAVVAAAIRQRLDLLSPGSAWSPQLVSYAWTGSILTNAVVPNAVVPVDPADIAADIDRQVRADLAAPDMPAPYVYALCLQMWAVSASPAEVDRLRRHRRPQLHRRTDRSPIDAAVAVDIHGRCWTAVRRLDPSEPDPTVEEQFFDVDAAVAPEGIYIDALRAAAALAHAAR